MLEKGLGGPGFNSLWAWSVTDSDACHTHKFAYKKSHFNARLQNSPIVLTFLVLKMALTFIFICATSHLLIPTMYLVF